MGVVAKKGILFGQPIALADDRDHRDDFFSAIGLKEFGFEAIASRISAGELLSFEETQRLLMQAPLPVLLKLFTLSPHRRESHGRPIQIVSLAERLDLLHPELQALTFSFTEALNLKAELKSLLGDIAALGIEIVAPPFDTPNESGFDAGIRLLRERTSDFREVLNIFSEVGVGSVIPSPGRHLYKLAKELGFDSSYYSAIRLSDPHLSLAEDLHRLQSESFDGQWSCAVVNASGSPSAATDLLVLRGLLSSVHVLPPECSIVLPTGWLSVGCTTFARVSLGLEPDWMPEDRVALSSAVEGGVR